VTVEQVEAAGAKVWLDEALRVRFEGPDAVKDHIRSDPNIKIELRKDLMIREYCQLCRRFKVRSRDMKTFWEDLEALPRKVALGFSPERAKELATMLLGITRPDWDPLTGKDLTNAIHRIFETKN
jgi:hypothetical protein